MELPLTSQIYLLAYDTDKGKLTCNGYLGYILRAAALTELHLQGALADADGRPRATGAKVHDALLAEVLREIASAPKPKKWSWWVHHGQTPMFRAVQQRLADGRVVTTERYRILGIFPATRVKVHEHRAVARLRSAVSHTLNGGDPKPRDAALTALAATGEIRIAVSRAQTRQYAKRLDSLVAQAGPALPALRKVIRDHRAATESG
ncbi:hypothetical protein CS0771_65280 [Catellatospora sp. IY07-71]|uniref:GOLPH3/VPS74 family protein n=1 Tax=Catellatospora sp. IY07-71 TaxID=2728827 RepID=UPI001BB45CD2|nr:GPP34 family phosphoprotein [Catellatospora sp. IY07-71]BCJ76984.1 hypothetical protein CS0771_65280 [Catellatospora sp. IY07-71]